MSNVLCLVLSLGQKVFSYTQFQLTVEYSNKFLSNNHIISLSSVAALLQSASPVSSLDGPRVNFYFFYFFHKYIGLQQNILRSFKRQFGF